LKKQELNLSIRILVVEDDILQRDVLATMLQGQGYYVETAENGLDALVKARVGWFDLILMDYMIPEVDGLATARLITDLTKATGRPRLIALSAAPEALLAREAGAKTVFDAVEKKPWDAQSLLATVKRCHEAAPNPGSRWAAANEVLITRSGRRRRVAEQWVATPGREQPAICDDLEPDETAILVVDDDDLLLSFFKSALESEGYSVDTATNGLDALRKIAINRYEIVILDYQMPEIDGLATARLIVELVGKADRPQLIALSSAAEQLTDREAGCLTVFDVIVPKSHGMESVLSAVKRSLDYRRRPVSDGPINVKQLAARLYSPPSARSDTKARS